MILSDGYLDCGYLPVRIAFRTLAAILLGTNVSIFCYTHSGKVSHLLRAGLFFVDLVVKLHLLKIWHYNLWTYSVTDCLELLTMSNICKVCQCMASFPYIQQPCAAITEIRRGIPCDHNSFWSDKGMEGLYRLYLALTATPFQSYWNNYWKTQHSLYSWSKRL